MFESQTIAFCIASFAVTSHLLLWVSVKRLAERQTRIIEICENMIKGQSSFVPAIENIDHLLANVMESKTTRVRVLKQHDDILATLQRIEDSN